MTTRLIIDLIRGGPETNSPGQLLRIGSVVLVYIIITFAFLYWELDGGGPESRARASPEFPDFAFPEHLNPQVARPGWRPAFFDYLYLAFTNALAFSPDRRHAAGSLGQAGDGRAGDGLSGGPGARHRPSSQHPEVTRAAGVVASAFSPGIWWLRGPRPLRPVSVGRSVNEAPWLGVAAPSTIATSSREALRWVCCSPAARNPAAKAEDTETSWIDSCEPLRTWARSQLLGGHRIVMLAKHGLDLFRRFRNSMPRLTDDRLRQLGGVAQTFRSDTDPVQLAIRGLRT